MNVYKVKNQSKLLSRFNSISQPQLSALLTPDTNQQLQAIHTIDSKNNSNKDTHEDSHSFDSTKKFLGQVKWTNNASSLKSLITDKDNDIGDEKLTDSTDSELSIDNFFQDNFPMLVRVVKGSYGIIKENDSTLSKKYVNNLLLCGKTRSVFILCQSIKFKDKKPFVYGKNISIPITYVSYCILVI
jgi:hypothetical protein